MTKIQPFSTTLVFVITQAYLYSRCRNQGRTQSHWLLLVLHSPNPFVGPVIIVKHNLSYLSPIHLVNSPKTTWFSIILFSPLKPFHWIYLISMSQWLCQQIIQIQSIPLPDRVFLSLGRRKWSLYLWGSCTQHKWSRKLTTLWRFSQTQDFHIMP